METKNIRKHKENKASDKNYNSNPNNANKKNKNKLFDLIEKSNPLYLEINSKRSIITSAELEDFNKFCNINLKLKTNLYASFFSIIYLVLSVISFVKYKSDFFGISFMILTISNLLVLIFEHIIKKCKTMNSFLFKFFYFFIFFCFLITLYEFLYFLCGKKSDDLKSILNNFIIYDFIDFTFCILAYSMIFAFSINSYCSLIIIKIVNILVFILLKNNNFSSNNNDKTFDLSFSYVNNTIIQINSINLTDNFIDVNNTKNITFSSDMIIDSNYTLFKKIYCLLINLILFCIFCFINKALNTSLIQKYKFELLMTTALNQEKNLCAYLNTKKLIFKNNELIKNDFYKTKFFDFKKSTENFKFENNNEEKDKSKLNKLNKLKNFFFKEKDNSIKVSKNLINDSANSKLNNNNFSEIAFKNLNVKAFCDQNNLNFSNENNINLQNIEIDLKIKEKQLSESIDDILNNPNSFIMKQMEHLQFLKEFQKLKADENFFVSFNNFNADENVENINYFANNKCSNMNFYSNNLNYLNADKQNNENHSLRAMAPSRAFDTENLNSKANSDSNLFYEIINFMLKNSFNKNEKTNNNHFYSGLNFTSLNKNAKRNNSKNYLKIKSKLKPSKENLNEYCYFGTYIKKKNETNKNYNNNNNNNNNLFPKINPNQEENKIKIIKIFYQEVKSKKLNFLQFYFEEIFLDFNCLKNFCSRNLNFISDETKSFIPIPSNWLDKQKQNMVLKADEDYTNYSITTSNNLFKENNKTEFLFKEKFENLKIKKILFKKTLNLITKVSNSLKKEMDDFAYANEENKIKAMQNLISLQEDNLTKFNRLNLVISKKASLDFNYFNLGKLVEFTKAYLNYIYKRILKSDSSNYNSSQLGLSSKNFNNININNCSNKAELEKNNTNAFIFSNIGEQYKKEITKDLFVNIDMEVYKQILFNLVFDLSYSLKEHLSELEHENSLTQEIIFNNDNEIKFDNNNYSTMRFSRLFEHVRINRNENDTEINEHTGKAQVYLEFEINGNLDSEENIILIELVVTTYSTTNLFSNSSNNNNNDKIDLNKSGNKNLQINNTNLFENGSKTFGSNSANKLFVKKKINRTNTSTVNLPLKFRRILLFLILYKNIIIFFLIKIFL